MVTTFTTYRLNQTFCCVYKRYSTWITPNNITWCYNHSILQNHLYFNIQNTWKCGVGVCSLGMIFNARDVNTIQTLLQSSGNEHEGYDIPKSQFFH